MIREIKLTSGDALLDQRLLQESGEVMTVYYDKEHDALEVIMGRNYGHINLSPGHSVTLSLYDVKVK